MTLCYFYFLLLDLMLPTQSTHYNTPFANLFPDDTNINTLDQQEPFFFEEMTAPIYATNPAVILEYLLFQEYIDTNDIALINECLSSGRMTLMHYCYGYFYFKERIKDKTKIKVKALYNFIPTNCYVQCQF